MPNTFSGVGSFSGAGSLSAPIVYSIGDTGPGGGKIFYDAGSTLSWGRYMEAANSSTSPAFNLTQQLNWSGNGNTLVGTSTAIGAGLTNSIAIVAQNSTANKAATRCRSYTGGGKTDWFLPSRLELAQLYLQKTVVGGFPTSGTAAQTYYWASSEQFTSDAHIQSMVDGTQDYSDKGTGAFPVRAIRYV